MCILPRDLHSRMRCCWLLLFALSRLLIECIRFERLLKGLTCRRLFPLKPPVHIAVSFTRSRKMLEGLFDEESGKPASVERKGEQRQLPPPPPPMRSASSLVGLVNQGATCYLNSLIQMLRMTPEFRDGIFNLPREELEPSSQDGSGFQGRRIPLQLQKLFARLMLADRDSVTTDALTSSFGWDKNEHRFQQDIHELLQVLFSAICESLQGCSGQTLIADLYGGSQVWKTTCSVCHHESASVDEFIDVTLAIAEATSVEQSLQQLYCGEEKLEKSNQYHCSSCMRKVDATRSTKFLKLPPILILTLNRFKFDQHRGQRCKENKAFSYPMELNMAAYMERSQPEDYWYDLFCVVLHRGATAFGGHYHAFIKDVQSLGLRTEQGKAAVKEVPSSPTATLREVLGRQPEKTLTMDKLCAAFSKLAGASWSKMYKRKCGPISKYLQENDDLFLFNQATQSVTLKELQPGQTPKSSKSHAARVTGAGEGASASASKPPPPSQAWFDFDDGEVMPLDKETVTLHTHRSGTAYMLAYRRRSLKLQPPTLDPPFYNVPHHLATEVFEENARLAEERATYDKAVNKLTLQLHPLSNYKCSNGILYAVDPEFHVNLTMDGRQTLAELYTEVSKSCAGLIPQKFTLHRMRDVDGILHLYEELEGPSSQLQALDLQQEAMLFVWDGQMVLGEEPNRGPDSEPIHLDILHENNKNSSLPYPKSMTFAAFRAAVSYLTDIPEKLLVLRKVIHHDQTILLQASDDVPLSKVPLVASDQVVAEKSIAEETVILPCQLKVENHFPKLPSEGTWTPVDLSIPFSATVANLKHKIMEAYNLDKAKLLSRIRVKLPSGKLTPPVDEALTITNALISSNSTVVVEPGPELRHDQMMIFYTYKGEEWEAVVRRSDTVAQVLQQIKHDANLPGDKWFLCKTNMWNKPAEALENFQATLEEYSIYSGDYITLEMGVPTSQNNVQLEVILWPTCLSVVSLDSLVLLAYLQNHLEGSGEVDSVKKVKEYRSSKLSLGYLDVAMTATLQELKEQIRALPLLASLVPPVRFDLRLRKMEGGQAGGFFRDLSLTVGKCRLAKAEQIVVQLVTEEDKLQPNDLVLELVQRVPGSRSYMEPVEIIWHAPKPASPVDLRQHLAKITNIPEEFLMTAKYFPTKRDWLNINGVQVNTSSKKGKKKADIYMNLRHGPFNLQNGDIIGVKDLRELKPDDVLDDFATEEDSQFLEETRQKNDNKQNSQMESRQSISEDGGSGDIMQAGRQKELGVVIRTDSFQ